MNLNNLYAWMVNTRFYGIRCKGLFDRALARKTHSRQYNFCEADLLIYFIYYCPKLVGGMVDA